MSQLIRPIRAFLLLFQVAKPVPTRELLPGAVLLLTWLLATGWLATPALPLALAAGIVAFLTVKLPVILPRFALVLGVTRAALLALLVTTVPLMILMQADPVAAPSVITLASLCVASVYAAALSDKSGAILRLIWPDKRMEAMRGDLARVFLLKQIALAFGNELVWRSFDTATWVACVALLPVVMHYCTSASTTAVFLAHQNRS